jgi:hypothetical protein
MSVALDPKGGKYHGYVSEFAKGCKLGSWTSNSYINHLVADTPTGPWHQGGVAVPIWAHNPRVVISPTDGKWLLYGIMGGARTPHDCGGPSHPPGQPGGETAMRAKGPQHATGTSSPFAIQHADSPDGPWTAVDGRRPNGKAFPRMTLHRDVDNVDAGAATEYTPESGVMLREANGGPGKLFLAATAFKPIRLELGSGRTAAVFGWDACSDDSPLFDNGTPVWSEETGTRIGGFEVVGDRNFAVEVAVECAITFDYPDGFELHRVTSQSGLIATSPGCVPCVLARTTAHAVADIELTDRTDQHTIVLSQVYPAGRIRVPVQVAACRSDARRRRMPRGMRGDAIVPWVRTFTRMHTSVVAGVSRMLQYLTVHTNHHAGGACGTKRALATHGGGTRGGTATPEMICTGIRSP